VHPKYTLGALNVKEDEEEGGGKCGKYEITEL
jgi:hypothetical protein